MTAVERARVGILYNKLHTEEETIIFISFLVYDTTHRAHILRPIA